MARILHDRIQGTLAEFLITSAALNNEGTIYETDTGDSFIVKNGMWENQNPVKHSIVTSFSKFIPFTDQTGLTFGDAFWSAINSELMSDGSQVFQARTSASVVHEGAWMGLDDFALPTMYPKVEMTFKFDDTGANSNAYIGFSRDAWFTNYFDLGTFWIEDNEPVFGMGYQTTDTNLKVLHNDSSGAVNSVDTGIARSTNVIKLTEQFINSTTAYIKITDVNDVTLYSNTFTTEIPGTTVELQWGAHITNFNTSARYGINMYDYIYLEKQIPTPTGVLT